MAENFPVGSVEDFDFGYSVEDYDAGMRNLLRWFSYVIEGITYEVMAIDLSTGAHVAMQHYYEHSRVCKRDIEIALCGLVA